MAKQKHGIYSDVTKKIIGIVSYDEDGKMLIEVNGNNIDPTEELRDFDGDDILIMVERKV